MTKAFNNSTTDDFKKSFGLSLAIHLFIIAIFLIKFLFYSKPLIDFSEAISVNLAPYQETNKLPPKVQAPPAAEPESATEAAPKPDAETAKPEKLKEAEKAKTTTKSPEAINLNKTKNKQKEALSKLKKLSALEKIKQDVKKDIISKIRAQKTRAAIVAAGTSLTGLDKLQANSYLQELDFNIKQFWALPQWLIHKPLKAQALVKFNLQGQIISAQIVSSSGNSSYDQYCLHAINKAAPFPKVPDKLSEKFSVDGVVIGFPE